MTAEQMWLLSGLTGPYEAWAFGEAADELADLVLRGIKTATCSAYDLYEAEGEPLSDCPEGVLRWIPRAEALSLPLWEGDRVFLPLLDTRQDCFSLKLIYAPGGRLTGWAQDGKKIQSGENE